MKNVFALDVGGIYYIVWNIRIIDTDNPYEIEAIADYVSTSLPGQIHRQERVYINKSEIHNDMRDIQQVKKRIIKAWLT